MREQLLNDGFKEVLCIRGNKTIIFEDYLINRDGKIFSLKRKRFLNGCTDKGYRYFALRSCNKKYNCYLHILLASTFINEIKMCGDYELVHHLDHDCKNNELSNLIWLSNKEHIKYHANSEETKKR